MYDVAANLYCCYQAFWPPDVGAYKQDVQTAAFCSTPILRTALYISSANFLLQSPFAGSHCIGCELKVVIYVQPLHVTNEFHTARPHLTG